MDLLIARAIDYLYEHWQEQPSLDVMADEVGLAPHHFQRRFKARCGLSPKRFVQALTLEQAKRSLRGGASLLETAFDAGLSGPSRLHDLFVAAEAVTPGDFKARGGGLDLRVGAHAGPFGRVAVAASERGLAWLGFIDDGDCPLDAVAQDYPLARLIRDDAGTAAMAARAFAWATGEPADLKLDLRGTAFQLQVWRALLTISPGETASYADVARRISAASAVRAVGRAAGANRVALVIPCHRVIRAGGGLGGYRWGEERKSLLLHREQAGTADEVERHLSAPAAA